MSGYTIAAIVTAIILVLPMILGSLVLCAPKWWRHNITPYLESSPRLQRVLFTELNYDFGGPSLTFLFIPFKYLIAFLVGIVGLIGLIIAWWYQGVFALVENKCPYTLMPDASGRVDTYKAEDQKRGFEKVKDNFGNLLQWVLHPKFDN